MADPICRWRNSSVKQLIEFNSIFPLTPTEKSKARALVERNWQLFGGSNFFTTPYQLAAQMGIYYESDTMLYPRFDRLVNINEACEYMQHWGRRYYAPNPYTKSIHQEKSVIINNFLVNWAIDKGENALFSEALRVMFSAEIGNTDILINMINNFSEVQITDDIVVLKDSSTARYSEKDVWLDVNPNDKEMFFNLVGLSSYTQIFPSFSPLDQPLQQIFYGAPGTGKSHTIKKTTDGVDSKFVVRTTFHPDSDYSTFVGAYKPKMEVMPRYNPQTGEQMGVEKRIVYAYTPQAFLKAYITAWQNPEQPVYLIIEEINRGNCAQIFGDLFQLLDRGDDGLSCYPIKADQDMQMHLMEVFAGYDALPENIRLGEELVLPPNLYIWATMNTSDQSLFPIDSAFKRRWEWKYIPITQGKDKESGKLMQWSIEAEGVSYDWWSFLEVMNKRVGDITSSEDKKLGFFFCKADGQGVISADKLVSKVMFYLWNDVFKDYPDNPIAMYLKEEGGEFTYGDFYTTNAGGDVVVREELVTRLLDALGVKVNFENENEDENENINADNTGNYTKRHLKVIYPDGTVIEHNNSTTTLLKVIDNAGPERVAGLNLFISEYPLVSKGKIPQDGKGYADSQRPVSNGYWVVTKFDTSYKMRKLVEISEKLGLGLKVSIVE